jgi:hypothetical protein
MRTYEIEIIGRTTIEVEADTYNEARQKAKILIDEGYYDEAVAEHLIVGSGVCISEDTVE